MKYFKLLKKIGFSEKEAVVYIKLIQLGPQPASVVSRNTEINRTTVYDILEGLKKRGIVRSLKKGGSTKHQVARR